MKRYRRSHTLGKNLSVSRGAISCIALVVAFSAACAKMDSDEVSDFALESIRSNLVSMSEAMSVIDSADSPWAILDWLDQQNQEPHYPNKSEPMPSVFDEIEQIVNELIAELENHIFTDENVESVTRNEVVYLLNPDVVCVFSGGAEPYTDLDCVKVLTEVPIRLVASWGDNREHLIIEIRVGEEPYHPLELHLSMEFIRVMANLGDIIRTVETIANVFGESMDADFHLEGKVQAELASEAAGQVSFALSILETLDFALQDRNDPEHVRLQLGPAEGFKVEFSAEMANSSLEMGSIDIAVARDLLQGGGKWECDEHNCEWVEPDAPLTGVFDIHLAGATGSVSVQPDDRAVTLTGLGLGDGPASFSLNSLPLLVVDLNESDGRRFDLTIEEADGDFFMSFAPAFDLHLEHDLSGLLEGLNEELPAWLLGGFTSITLDGAASPMLRFFQMEYEQPVPVGPNGEEPEQPEYAPEPIFQVLEGSLGLDASELTSPVVIESPDCAVLLDVADANENDHPFGYIGAGDCE